MCAISHPVSAGELWSVSSQDHTGGGRNLTPRNQVTRPGAWHRAAFGLKRFPVGFRPPFPGSVGQTSARIRPNVSRRFRSNLVQVWQRSGQHWPSSAEVSPTSANLCPDRVWGVIPYSANFSPKSAQIAILAFPGPVRVCVRHHCCRCAP